MHCFGVEVERVEDGWCEGCFGLYLAIYGAGQDGEVDHEEGEEEEEWRRQREEVGQMVGEGWEAVRAAEQGLQEVRERMETFGGVVGRGGRG